MENIIKIFLKIFSKIIVQNKRYIVFESFHGRNYSDSPRYIYEYLIKKQRDYKYIWVLENLNTEIPGNVIKVKKNSLMYIYYIYRSKYWIFNNRISYIFPKKKNNIYLQTWHGIPLKKLGFDIDEYKGPKNKKYKEKLKKCVARWDYLLSPNKYSSKIFKECFGYSKEILEYGYPRNQELLFNNTLDNVSKIKEKLNLKNEKKIILYAPTFRDDEFNSKNKNIFKIKIDLNEMRKKLKKEYIIILRLHYNIFDIENIDEFKDFVYDFTKYDNINDLYLIADILITDYSSIMFDYMLLNRPIIYYVYDLEKYRDKLRGFYFNFEKEAPGPLVNSTPQLIENILNITKVQENYIEKYKQFKKEYCDTVNEKTNEKIIEKIFIENKDDYSNKKLEETRWIN